ncbi:HMG domain-containing protein 3 [Synchiropus splendidus]|uniref:HMG domain-containing protein 3 n=1 Tax=Synchiropus splendidus TaxID=270530 RepID=UPI00237DB7CB|nr:HMG domain-containing protein 3 [Synchiropus splendidus]
MEKVGVYEVMTVTEEVENSCNMLEMSPKKKRHNKAQIDCIGKPKKPRSAYLLYYFDVHQLMQQDAPNLPQSEINKRISESWKSLSVAEKSYYLEKAQSEKDGTDVSSLSPSKDLPGFRKILPRSSYFILAKGSTSSSPPSTSSTNTLGSLPTDVPLDCTEPPVDGFPSLSLPPEAEVHTLDMASEVELSEQANAIDNLNNPAATFHSTSYQVLTTSSSQNSSLLSKHKAAPKDETAAPQGYSGLMLQPIQTKTSQVVAVIQNQNLLAPKSLTSTMGPVIVASMGASSTPSYKMSVKKYTRRGHGKCPSPGCSYVYVTRHKPPTCPTCGYHLGGKWIPVAKKVKGQADSASKKPPDATESKESSQPMDTNKPKPVGSKNLSPCSNKISDVPLLSPAEGSSTQRREQQQQLKKVVSSPSPNKPTVKVRPARPILPACQGTGHQFVQIITIPSVTQDDQTHSSKKSSATVPPESLSGLKPSTLKQLGQTVTTTTTSQASTSLLGGKSSADKPMNLVSVVPVKQSTFSCADLGLSTARGRGRCKNPSCDYVYKNRYKPAVCPKCGNKLTQGSQGKKSVTLVDPHQPLTAAQKDLQRQSTLQLLRRSLQIPENEAELQEVLNIIQEFNSLQIILVQLSDQQEEGNVETGTLVESGWPQFYQSSATHCGLCNTPLYKGGQSTIAGQEDCWLLTEALIQSASLQLKVCPNIHCLALHSFTDLHPALFNIGNKLLVTIDLFLRIRSNIKLGHPPAQVAATLLDHVPSHPVHSLRPEESSQIQELLLTGYWAFECLTVRDYNDMICGICGVAPKVEMARRHTDNVLELKNVEFTWPEVSIPDEVHVDDFWLTMESEAIEQAAFPSDIPIIRVDASIIAPFIPPLMRGPTVVNTEKDKVLPNNPQPAGDPSVLVRLIHDGQLRLDAIEDHSEEELRTILQRCGANVSSGHTKDELLASLVTLYTTVHSGLSTAPQPSQHLTAGKLSKVCPHKVVCGSKYLVRGETARDHVDLLLSSRFWPPVYVSDCARQVALCTDVQYPEVAVQMWGRNQGCFSDPFEKPEFVSCPELQDQASPADLPLLEENQHLHPMTKSSSHWLVHPPGAGQDQESPEHHSMALCRELEPYRSLLADADEGEPSDKPQERAPQQPIVFNNTAFYYIYNRLVDFLSSRDIVTQQIKQVVKACQPGEVVIRDALYRLGVAQIKREGEEETDREQLQVETETVYEVLVHQ